MVFKITPSGTFSTVYNFCSQSGCADRNDPEGLIQAANGDFYGTTESRGAGENGLSRFRRGRSVGAWRF
jgi:hypothetical protein